MTNYHNFYFKKSGKDSLLLSTQIINFFMVLTPFVPSAYWRSHTHI